MEYALHLKFLIVNNKINHIHSLKNFHKLQHIVYKVLHNLHMKIKS